MGKKEAEMRGQQGDTSAGSEASPPNTTPCMGREGAQCPLLMPSLTGNVSAHKQMAG